MIEWLSLTNDQKTDRVSDLHNVRQEMQLEARSKRATKPRKSRRNLKTSFKSKELEDLFNLLPPDMQKLVS